MRDQRIDDALTRKIRGLCKSPTYSHHEGKHYVLRSDYYHCTSKRGAVMVTIAQDTPQRPLILRPRYDTIPAELKKKPQFVIFRYEWDAGKNDWNKAPRTPTTGKLASTTDPATWGTFEEARVAVERGDADGLGFVFTPTDPYAGIDLDHCIDPKTGEMALWAQTIIAGIPSYWEKSPRQEGVKGIVKAVMVPGSKHKNKAKTVEMYDQGRYFTLTGHMLPNADSVIAACQEDFDALYRRVMPESTRTERAPNVHEPLNLDDARLIERAMAASNGPRFTQLWGGDVSGNQGDESAADLALCSLLAFWTGPDPARIDRLFRQSKLMREKWDRADYRDRTIDAALAGRTKYYTPLRMINNARSSRNGATDGEDTDEESMGNQENDGRPEINAAESDLPVITQAAWAALQQANTPPHLFRHAGKLARLEVDDLGTPLLAELTDDRTRHELARAALWFKVGAKGTTDFVLPPSHVVKDVLATPNPPLPVLTRIVEAPVFSASGNLQTLPGYHDASRTYYAPAKGLQIPSVSLTPTVEERARARSLILDDLLHDFPFVGQEERANAVALYLLPFVRDMIQGPTPNHLIEAPVPGTGKGLLADMLLLPSVGQQIGIMVAANDDAEWRKSITTAIRSAKSAILIDNMTRALDSGVLAAAITGLTWDDRLLGSNDMFRAPVTCVWVTTGNNPQMSTELARRTVRIRLDTRVDRPWQREDGSFKHPQIRTWAIEHRGELVWAGLTLVQAWLADGRPNGSTTLGSFESWSRVLGGILTTAGITGFLQNLDAFYEVADRETEVWRQFVAQWWEKFQSHDVGAVDLFPLAEAMDGIELGRGGDRSQRIVFGKHLMKLRDRVIGNYRIALAGKKKSATQWQLVSIRPTEDTAAQPEFDDGLI